MYLFHVFRSFIPLRNPIGFGSSDFLFLTIASLLAFLLIARAFLAPHVGKLANRPLLSMLVIAALVVVLRVSLFVHSPPPIPTGADDFSYVLLGDTMRHLRFANATHPLHQFFESTFILQEPTYASIYPPGMGIALAFGKWLFRSFWSGILVSGSIFCASCYWMLRAWVSARWAFVGGLLAVIQFGPLNPWMNSYWGGYLSGIAGCLVFGALPRLVSSPAIGNGLLLGLGFAMQLLTRPFETLFLAMGAIGYMAFSRRSRRVALRTPLLACGCVVLMAVIVTLIQNKAVTNSWTTLPYLESRNQYGVPTTFTFQPNPIPHRSLTPQQELDYRAQSAIHGDVRDTLVTYWQRLMERFRYLRFFALPPLYLALLTSLPRLRDRKYIWMGVTVALFLLGTNFYAYFYPHYLAAITCLFITAIVVGLDKMTLKIRRPVILASLASFGFWFVLYASGDPDLVSVNDFQSWNYINIGDRQGRQSVEARLANSPGGQLVFVRYSPSHRFEEWVHNDADIDDAKTVWANDLGPEENTKLLQYYPNRNAWLLEPDLHPVALVPYPRDTGGFLTVH